MVEVNDLTPDQQQAIIDIINRLIQRYDLPDGQPIPDELHNFIHSLPGLIEIYHHDSHSSKHIAALRKLQLLYNVEDMPVEAFRICLRDTLNEMLAQHRDEGMPLQLAIPFAIACVVVTVISACVLAMMACLAVAITTGIAGLLFAAVILHSGMCMHSCALASEIMNNAGPPTVQNVVVEDNDDANAPNGEAVEGNDNTAPNGGGNVFAQ